MNEHMVTMDPPDHTRERALIMRLITSKRLKENEAFMSRLADQLLDEFIADGHCEFISAYSQPFAMLVVADLLGVPEEDHQRFREGFGLSQNPGGLGGSEENQMDLNALAWLDAWFAEYIEDRRRQPRQDVLTDLALATYPDGTMPEVTSVVRTATFLFAAGQETTARLLAVALKYLADNPGLQDELRSRNELIPGFIEEALRIESPVKADFRLARRSTTIGGVDIAAGTPVMLLNGAANRDPRRFEDPAEFHVERPELPGAHGIRPRCSHLSGWSLGPGRGARQPRPRPGPDAGHPPVRGASWASRSPSLQVRTHVGPPRSERAASRVHARRREPVSPVAVVTGGASGIGLGVARRFVADGHDVAILDRNGAGADAAAAELQGGGARVLGVEVDVADRKSVEAAFALVRAELGPIGMLVTSAGVESFDPLLEITAEKWDRIIAVNLTGTFTCVQAAVPDMLAAGWGRIVTISSSSAQSGAPNMAHYAASKGGVIALTKALAVDLARSGITVNTIPPSLVDTPMARAAEAAGDFPGVDVVGPMVPLGRAGTPDDIAAACSFLCSEGGSYITGQIIGVNGGMYI